MHEAFVIKGSDADDVILAAEDAGVKITHGVSDTYLTGLANSLMYFTALLATANGGDNTSLVAILASRLSTSMVTCGDVPGTTRWTFDAVRVEVGE
jgi:hypothetical protein